MFHIELRKFPHAASSFNLSEAELRAIVLPWVRKEWLEVAERKWNPEEATLTILEGPHLESKDLSMGRGWRTAQKRSEDVTERVLSAAAAAEQARAQALETARIEEAARAQLAARDDPKGRGSATGVVPATAASSSPATAADPLTLGVQLASLLGPRPTELLGAWQKAAANAPRQAPSETLAIAERDLASSEGALG